MLEPRAAASPVGARRTGGRRTARSDGCGAAPSPTATAALASRAARGAAAASPRASLPRLMFAISTAASMGAERVRRTRSPGRRHRRRRGGWRREWMSAAAASSAAASTAGVRARSQGDRRAHAARRARRGAAPSGVLQLPMAPNAASRMRRSARASCARAVVLAALELGAQVRVDWRRASCAARATRRTRRSRRRAPSPRRSSLLSGRRRPRAVADSARRRLGRMRRRRRDRRARCRGAIAVGAPTVSPRVAAPPASLARWPPAPRARARAPARPPSTRGARDPRVAARERAGSLPEDGLHLLARFCARGEARRRREAGRSRRVVGGRRARARR